MRGTIIALVLGIVIVASTGPTATAQEADAGVLEAVKALTPEDVRALIKSAQVGDARAQLMLALAYHHGYTVAQIQTEALKWCRMAAEQGVAHAQHLLGQMYRDGRGVDQKNEAAKWIGMAAEQGFAEAEYEYGLMSLDGIGVPQDQAEAFKWFDRAAEQESLGGQTYVGFMYVNGLGVTKNLSEGRRYLLAAANRGSPMAQANLGTLYANGMGVAKDPAEALMWFLMADAGEFEGVQALIDELESQMTEEDVTEAKRQADIRSSELRSRKPEKTPSQLDIFSEVTGPVDFSQVFEAADEPPERISCPPLVYPRMMQQANIKGNVILQFIVDTTGHVERGSSEVINSTHRAFEGAARDMILRCRFRPGRVRGRAVRALMRLPIIFALQGR